MKRDIEDFVAKCPNCQQVKVEYLKSYFLLEGIQISTKKWEDININIVVCLCWTKKSYDSIWVVVNRFTMFEHFIPVKS